MKFAVYATLVVLSLATLPYTDADDTTPAPRLVVDNLSRSFGTVNRGESVEMVFKIQNTGTAPLKFERIEFSRPDMNIRIQQEVLPDETIEAAVLWNTSRFGGDYDGVATLYSNDPEHPVLSLRITGKVRSPLTILPRPALYLSQFEGQEVSQFLEIRNNQDKDVSISRLERVGSHFEAVLTVIEEGRRYQVEVKIPAKTPVGKYEERLLIHTDDHQNPKLHAAINILVKSSVHVSSQHIDFGTISLKELASTPGMSDFLSQTLVINRQKGEMRITGIDSDLDFLRIAADPTTPSNAFRIDVQLHEERLKPGAFSGQALLETDDPDFKELSISVAGKVVP
jgi:hypothetical protein